MVEIWTFFFLCVCVCIRNISVIVYINRILQGKRREASPFGLGRAAFSHRAAFSSPTADVPRGREGC